MNRYFTTIHWLLMVFTTAMYVIGHISRTDAILLLIFYHLTYNEYYEEKPRN